MSPGTPTAPGLPDLPGGSGGSSGSEDSGLLSLAHGLGGQRDLPIPLDLAVTGAVAALVVSFTVLALAWRTPRYATPSAGRPTPAWLDTLVSSTGFKVALRVVGFAFFLFTLTAAVLGRDSLINPFLGIFYIWIWVGLVPLSLLLGPVWRAISPVRTINRVFAKLSGSDPSVGLYTYPARLGYWPAALGLFAFVWMELVYPYSTDLGPVRLWCAVYVGVMLIGGALFGDSFYERADPFEVYSTLLGKLSVWARHEGRLVVRSPLANLSTVVIAPGLVGVVGVLFGSTGFDSFRESPTWVTTLRDSSVGGNLLNNLALLAFCAAAVGILAGASAMTGVGPDTRRRSLPDAFAFSVVPIVAGYMIAHYLTYLVQAGTVTLVNAADPLSNGTNLLGLGDLSVPYWLSEHPTLLATIKVLAVVVGHVLGVIAAHDRAIALLPRRHQLTGQLPLLLAMVVFTAGGLYLLFAA